MSESPSKSTAPRAKTTATEDVPLKLKKSKSTGTRTKSKDSRSKDEREKETVPNADGKAKEGSKSEKKAATVVSQTLPSGSSNSKSKNDAKKRAVVESGTNSGGARVRRPSRGAADKAKQKMSDGEEAKGSRKRRQSDLAYSDDDDDDDDDEWYENQTETMKQATSDKETKAKTSSKVPKKNDRKAMSNDKEVKKEKDDDDRPLIIAKKKVEPKGKTAKTKKKRPIESDGEDSEEEEDFKKKTPAKKAKTAVKSESATSSGKRKKSAEASGNPKKKAKEEPEIWKWWEEDRSKKDGVKWRTLSHKGPYFSAPYEPLPDSVHFVYKGKPFKLCPLAEEAAGFYARMLDHDYTSKPVFRDNFWADWRKAMTLEERAKITNFEKCDFSAIQKYYVKKAEERKQMSKEEKKKLKEQNEALQEEYGFCLIDGHRQKIGNWKIEPPGLFRGRGEHPKMGKLKKRIHAEDITINIGKEAKLPVPPSGRWGEVRHDNKVTWLASWIDTVNGERKYVLLNAASHLKGEKDWQKYETARKLKGNVERIRGEYKRDWKSKLMQDRQRGVAVYFIDKLALRAGNEKDTDEEADTVGCCSLRVEHIRLHDTWEGKEYVVEFDFLGKDSIRYINHVAVEKQVFKNLKRFMDQKEPGDDLFDRITTTTLNKHLQGIMPGLTAKVFRTYNASITLQEQLKALTEDKASVAEQLLSYNRANRQVAILCNHQRSIPKTFEQQMERLGDKIKDKVEKIAAAEKELKSLKKSSSKHSRQRKKIYALFQNLSRYLSSEVTKKANAVERLKTQLRQLEVQQTDKEENKTIALGTSKLNYLDPRITVAWCKKLDVPLEKIYNKTQREKFAWAIHMADETFEF
ncbi:DNA topoisomerase I, mitochondrial-like isoform X2 [Oscarella lobularis]|uniref:DNA topoisomerase I, mitochondrial-like isoform X2 n=1 Tax=Oscarella lobularis TaxID=121494 RepID=UPI003313DAA4